MRYRGILTVPAGTAKADPARETVKVTSGVILEVEVFFPAGQVGLVSVAIHYHEKQILPTSPEVQWIGNDDHITVSEHFPVLDAPHVLELVGWAPDTTLDHKVYVDISIERPQVMVAGGAHYVALPDGL